MSVYEFPINETGSRVSSILHRGIIFESRNRHITVTKRVIGIVLSSKGE